MHHQLKSDKENLHAIFNNTVALAEDFLNQQESLPPGRFVKDIDLTNIPEQGHGALKVLDYFKKNYAHLMCNSAGPRYFGFVTGGSTPASVAGDWLVSAFDQNAAGSNDSIAPQLEKQTIHFLKQLIGLNESYYGSFVTGATMSNFVGLALGRQWIGEQYGIDFSNDGLSNGPEIKVLSATPHSSVIKALSMLGMGRKSMIKIDTIADREAIDIVELEKYLQKINEPIIIVANAGTVNTADFDDIEAIGKLKSIYKFWLHVDAAFGGIAGCSEKYAHYLKGINYADSITIDAHKWLNVPYDAAMQFTTHKNLQLKVFQNSAAYLGDPLQSPDFFHYTPENSRRFRALPAWFSLMAYGAEGHREIVERNCEAAHQLGEHITASPSFRLLAQVRLNVVCFTLPQVDVTVEDVREFLTAIREDGQVFFTPTVYKGTPAIRAAISNWQTELKDIDHAITVLNKVYDALKSKLSYL